MMLIRIRYNFCYEKYCFEESNLLLQYLEVRKGIYRMLVV
jgi:hypothetical protein